MNGHFYLGAVEGFLSVNFQFSRSFYFNEIDQAKFYLRSYRFKIKAKALSLSNFHSRQKKGLFFIKLHKSFPLKSRPCRYLKFTLFVESLCKEHIPPTFF